MTEVVSSILGPLLQKLASLAVEEIQLVSGVKDDREKLKSTLEMIQESLADAEQRQTKEEAVRLWLSKLKDFCYDAEDVLDEFETRALWRRARWTEHLTFKSKVRYLSSWISDFIFQFKMARKMKELGNILDKINEEKTKFNLSSNVHEKAIVPRRETHSFVRPSNIIGRDEEKERIIELLKKSDDGGVGTIAVIPILGIGGIGKMALARLVHDDDRVKEHFKDCKVWLSMPVQFDVEKIIGDIVESLDPQKKNYGLEMQQNFLRSMVENKRYLFVMDDVWQVSREDWVRLTDLLGGVSKGSKVIVTSRNKSITSIMDTSSSFNLSDLSWEDSLTLFMNCAFDQGKAKNRLDLVVIGKEIVNKCRGNPLAVKTLGSLLYSKYNRSDWECVRDSEIWQSEFDILPSLRISYDLMPSYLKRCFAYCSLYPKNHIFEKYELIQLWISNGFIQYSGNNQELEEIGRQYLEELISRSFFDVDEEIYPTVTFRMHDLIHELAILVAQTESCNMKVRARDIPPRTRHISFFNPSGLPKDELQACLSKLHRVRTVVFEEGSSREFFLETCIPRFKQLRVLFLHKSSLDLLPSSIGSLKHLRCLHVCNSRNLKKIPKSVYMLRNLQYLGLAGCTELEELPADIKNMISLRLLFITTKQQRFPAGEIGCLTSLRMLAITGCKNLEALFDDIQLLTSLRKLWIMECPKLASLPQGIKNLKALEDLLILACESLRLPEEESNEPRSTSRLQAFLIGGLPEIVSLPGWLEGSASTLKRINIAYCPNLRELPEWLPNCSSLRTLEIEGCPELSSLPDGVRRIAALTKLRISRCEELSSSGEEDD
ncbi:hypothetical protein BT93_L1690 [Corymbia citriodora subsp. variegata]|uniref:Disease resistance protein RGA3 n=1 Tax=Corymbia citriodora subsp. variegata TaxID=360336 RepID=A0A8T0CWL1_CORYI|nr:hypothetical protein BT93_L1690 [Corymbia citriodora subsp. variegata]